VAAVLYAGLRNRWGLAGGAWAAGVLLKVYPVFLAPVILLWAYRSEGRRGPIRLALAAAGVGIVVLSPWLVTSPQTALDGVRDQAGRRFLEYGSFLGSTLVVARELGLTSFEYDEELDSRVLSSEASRFLVGLAPELILLGVAVAFIKFRARTRPQDDWKSSPPGVLLAGGLLLTHLAVLLAAPVFSPQYVLWLLPVLLVFVGISGPVVAAGVAVGLCIQVQNPLAEGLPRSIQPACLGVIFVVRDLSLIILTVVAWRQVGIVGAAGGGDRGGDPDRGASDLGRSPDPGDVAGPVPCGEAE
jgi:hypothetical protein